MKMIIKIFLILLIFPNSIFPQNLDLNAFQLGNTNLFSTKNHPKAKGINLNVQYPSSWIAKEGNRPNVVQNFVKESNGRISIMSLILINDLPVELKQFSDEELAQELFSSEGLKSLLANGSEIIDSRRTKYDGQPGAFITFRLKQQRSGMELSSYLLQHNFIYSNKLILIQCGVSGRSSNEKEISGMFQKYTPLFIQIGNSVVLYDKWKKPKNNNAHNEAAKEKSVFNDSFGSTLIISFLITWIIGLIPPLIIRFIFIKRELSKVISIIVVSLFWVFNLMIFTALGSQSEYHGALFLIAFVSYFILRKEKSKKSINETN